MKLKDVVHKERFCGEDTEEKFNFCSNRFELFDKNGRRLNSYRLRDVEGVLDLDVIETAEGGYNNFVYCVGFPVTHIKLDYVNNDLLGGSAKFGGVVQGGY